MPDIDIIIKAQDRASGSIKNVNRELGHLDDHGKRLPAPLRALSSALGVGLKVAAIGAAAALVGLGVALKNSIGAAIDMEQSVADIMAVMGKAAPPVEELNKAIQGLGLDPKLKVSATEAAAAINMLAKNGITWDEIQQGMARSTVLLANATNDDFALAADVATNAMVNFNKDAGDMEDVINGIIGVTQASQFDINDYALAIAQAGGVAGAVGVDFDDFNAVIAATSSSFSSGSDAGTSFKTFLQRLVPDTAPAKDAMRELGLLTEEGGNAFFTASGEMKSMSEIAELLQNATAGLSEEQKIQTMTTIFGTDAQRTAFALAAAGAETIDSLKAAIGDVSAEEAAATRMDTLKGSWEIFLGVVETLSIQLGTVFLPIARDLVEWATKMATEHGPKVIEWATKLTNAIKEFVPVLMNFVTNELPNWRTRWDDWAAAAWKWITEKALPAVLEKLGEWGAAVLGWVTTNLPAWTTKLGEWAVAAWQWIVDVTPTVVTKLGEWGAALWGWITTNAPTWATKLGEFAAKSWDWVKNEVIPKAGEKLGEWLGVLGQWAIDNAPTWATKLGEFATKTWDWLILTVIPTVGTKLGEWATALYTWATDPVNLKTWATKLSGWATAAWQWIVDAAGKVGGYLGDWYIALSTWIGTNLPLWVKNLGDWAKAAWQWIVDAAELIPGKLAEWWKAITTWYDENLPKFQKMMEEWGKAMVDATAPFGKWLLEKFPAASAASVLAANNLKTAFSNLLGETETSLGLSQTAMTNFMSGLHTVLDGGIAIMITRISNLVASFGTTIKLMDALGDGDWKRMWEAVAEQQARQDKAMLFEAAIFSGNMELAMKIAGQNTVQGFGEGVDAKAQFGVGAVRGLADDVKDEFEWALDQHSPSGVFKTYGTNTVQGFINGVDGMLGATGTKMGEVVNAVKNLFTDSINWLYQKGIDAVQGFVNGLGSMIEAAKAKAAEMAAAAAAAVGITLEAESPSRVFHRHGENAGQGFINGMNSKLEQARQAAISLAQAASTAVQSTVQAVVQPGYTAPASTALTYAQQSTALYQSQYGTTVQSPATIAAIQAQIAALNAAAPLITTVDKGAQRVLQHLFDFGEILGASSKRFNILDSIEGGVDAFVRDLVADAKRLGRVLAEDGTYVNPSFYAPAASTIDTLREYLRSTITKGNFPAISDAFKGTLASTVKSEAKSSDVAELTKLIKDWLEVVSRNVGTASGARANFTVNVQSTGDAVRDIRNQVELYALTFGATS